MRDDPAHDAVEGGFVCGIDGCEETRQTPLGIARHRERHALADASNDSDDGIAPVEQRSVSESERERRREQHAIVAADDAVDADTPDWIVTDGGREVSAETERGEER